MEKLGKKLPNLLMYTIKDLAAEEYCQPFCSKNDQTAKRQFRAMLKGSPHNWNEFELLEIGVFDPNDGTMRAESSGRLVQRGTDVVRIEETNAPSGDYPGM